jgi:hypothetical protein
MTSQYEKHLAELKSKGTALAEQYIPKLYDDLRKEQLTPQDARERIETDCADLWSKATIRKYLPDEAKNKEAQDKARKGNAIKSEKLTKARMDLAENGSVCQKEQEPAEKIERMKAITIDNKGRSAYLQEHGGDDKPNPAVESPVRSIEIQVLKKELEQKSRQILEKDAHIKRLEEEKLDLRKALKSASFPSANRLDEKVTRKTLDNQDESQLEPFECKSHLELKGQLVPLIVYCNPASRSVKVKVDTSHTTDPDFGEEDNDD